MAEQETLGQRIVRAYVGAEMTRAEFSRRLNTVYHQVLRWEAGATPELGTLKRIAELTGVSLKEPLEGDVKTDRDDSKGYASVERYIAEMEAAGTPVAPEHALDLRSWRRSRGEPEREEIIGYHRGMIAADARKAFERPIADVRIDEARGQKKITPIRKRKITEEGGCDSKPCAGHYPLDGSAGTSSGSPSSRQDRSKPDGDT